MTIDDERKEVLKKAIEEAVESLDKRFRALNYGYPPNEETTAASRRVVAEVLTEFATDPLVHPWLRELERLRQSVTGSFHWDWVISNGHAATQRALKERAQAQASKLEEENSALRTRLAFSVGIVEKFKTYLEMETRNHRSHYDNVNAPGHGHGRPGIWDSDNGPGKANKPCEFCALWNELKKQIAWIQEQEKP